ncbi:MAG: SEC-C metal-binding domain-containing protein, partial [Bacillota bacterium]|nr:SEC-C metal-binding domain-containing protein [Bacillota bacterium]
KGQPVLIGTISIEKSEILSSILKKHGIKHEVLNAKYHEKESQIIAQAGKYEAVTIATNMAGRGTDIMLGGNAEYMAKNNLVKEGFSEQVIVDAMGYADTDDEEVKKARESFRKNLEIYKSETAKDAELVKKAGGLLIIGTERHESRRIDNQLRGRSGRQGDPGESVFFISLEDELMRLFGSEKIMKLMDTLGLDEDTPIDQKMLSNAIETAQKRVESRNFQIRKHVLEYDDVMNKQREIIYGQRSRVLDGESLKEVILGMLEETVQNAVKSVAGEHNYLDTWQADEIISKFEGVFITSGSLKYTREELEHISPDDLSNTLLGKARAAYDKKEAELSEPLMRELERVVMLRNVDEKWMDHIDAMDELKRGIGLRAYAQTDPVVAYKHEGFEMFDEMIQAIREDTVRMIFLVRVRHGDEPKREKVARETSVSGTSANDVGPRQPIRKDKKPGRNDPCPCGSGKKYKKCCGANE